MGLRACGRARRGVAWKCAHLAGAGRAFGAHVGQAFPGAAGHCADFLRPRHLRHHAEDRRAELPRSLGLLHVGVSAPWRPLLPLHESTHLPKKPTHHVGVGVHETDPCLRERGCSSAGWAGRNARTPAPVSPSWG